MEEAKTIAIDIRLTKGLAVALSCALAIVTLLVCLMLTGESAVASNRGASGETSPAQSGGIRKYYLTDSTFDGNETLTACVEGYHFASLWEIVDPSNLEYDIDWGETSGDSGQGPPTGISGLPAQGWVRTGYSTNSSTAPGKTNCSLWDDDTSGENGTVVKLVSDWTSGGQDIGVWEAFYATCNSALRVWCVED